MLSASHTLLSCSLCRATTARFEGSFLHGIAGAKWRSRSAKGPSEDAVAPPQMGVVGTSMDRLAEELDESLQQVCTASLSSCYSSIDLFFMA